MFRQINRRDATSERLTEKYRVVYTFRMEHAVQIEGKEKTRETKGMHSSKTRVQPPALSENWQCNQCTTVTILSTSQGRLKRRIFAGKNRTNLCSHRDLNLHEPVVPYRLVYLQRLRNEN